MNRIALRGVVLIHVIHVWVEFLTLIQGRDFMGLKFPLLLIIELDDVGRVLSRYW